MDNLPLPLKTSIIELYQPSESIMGDYIIPFIIILIFIIIILNLYLKNNVNEAKLNWNVNKCIPKYMFISGFVKKNPNSGILGSTYDNFRSCIKTFINN